MIAASTSGVKPADKHNPPQPSLFADDYRGWQRVGNASHWACVVSAATYDACWKLLHQLPVTAGNIERLVLPRHMLPGGQGVEG